MMYDVVACCRLLLGCLRVLKVVVGRFHGVAVLLVGGFSVNVLTYGDSGL